MSRRNLVRRVGFTLVEAIASMAVLAVIAGASVSVTWSAVRGFTDGAETLRLQSQGSVAVERLTRELRAIPLDEAGTPDIQEIRADGATWAGGDRAVRLESGTLVYTRGGVDAVLCTDVTTFRLQAYDSVDTALGETLAGAECDAVRRIGIELALRSGEASTSLRTRVFVRAMALEEAP